MYVSAGLDLPDYYNPLLTLTIGKRSTRVDSSSVQLTNEDTIKTNPDVPPTTVESSQATIAREFLSKAPIAPQASKPRRVQRTAKVQKSHERYFYYESPLLQQHKCFTCTPSVKVLNTLYFTSEFQRLMTFDDTRARDQKMVELMSLITTSNTRKFLQHNMLSTQFPRKRRRIEPVAPNACLDTAGDAGITSSSVLDYVEMIIPESDNNIDVATDIGSDSDSSSIDYNSDAIEVKEEPEIEDVKPNEPSSVKQHCRKPDYFRPLPLKPRPTWHEEDAGKSIHLWDYRVAFKDIVPYTLGPDEPLFVTGPSERPQFRTLCPQWSRSVHQIAVMYDRLIPRYFFDRLTPEDQVVLPLPSSDLLHTFHGAVIQEKLAKKRRWAMEWGSPATLLCFTILLQEYMYHLLIARGT
ncbi:hypothetical protein H4R35_005812 [Dimargaris xerosporica]|nr:hypothetical protein H4R35_005812 [Dimargaris xerosporica]